MQTTKYELSNNNKRVGKYFCMRDEISALRKSITKDLSLSLEEKIAPDREANCDKQRQIDTTVSDPPEKLSKS